MSEFHSNFAKVIKQKRKELGLSQAELGEKLGANQKTVSRYELGAFPKDNKVLDEIIDTLGLTLVLSANDSLDELLSAAGYEIMWSNDQIIATKGGKSWLCSPIKKPQV